MLKKILLTLAFVSPFALVNTVDTSDANAWIVRRRVAPVRRAVLPPYPVARRVVAGPRRVARPVVYGAPVYRAPVVRGGGVYIGW